MGTSDRCWAYVRFGPKADVRRSAHEVCFVPVARLGDLEYNLGAV